MENPLSTPPGEQLRAPSGSHTLPSALSGTLRRLQTVEFAATGSQALAARRASGQLLAVALDLGWSAAALAECLGTTPDSIQSRATGGDWLTALEAERVLGLTPDMLARHTAHGRLPNTRVDANSEPAYHRRDVLLLLTSALAQQDDRAPGRARRAW